MNWTFTKEKARNERKKTIGTINECAIKRECSLLDLLLLFCPRCWLRLPFWVRSDRYTHICVYYKPFSGGMCCLAQWNKHLSSAVPLNVWHSLKFRFVTNSGSLYDTKVKSRDMFHPLSYIHTLHCRKMNCVYYLLMTNGSSSSHFVPWK